MTVRRPFSTDPSRFLALLSPAGGDGTLPSSASFLEDVFDSIESSGSSSSSSSDSYTIKYREEHFMPAWVAGVIIGVCAVIFAIAMLIAVLSCCRKRKLLDTDEDEERLMADEYFDPEDATNYSYGGSLRRDMSVAEEEEEESDSAGEGSGSSDELYAAPPQPAWTAKNRQAPPNRSAPAANKRGRGSGESDSVQFSSAKRGFYAAVASDASSSFRGNAYSNFGPDSSTDEEASEPTSSSNSSDSGNFRGGRRRR